MTGKIKSGNPAPALNPNPNPALDPSPANPFARRRAYQRAVITSLAERRRVTFLVWRRQGGKSTTLAEAAHYEMLRFPGRTVTYASASLLLGREIILKESEVMQKAIAHLGDLADQSSLNLQTADTRTHKVIKNLNADDFADLFEAQRLEFRLYHSPSRYSRTQVIAPNAATARGWTGTVLLDEIGFIPDFEQLWVAIEPIVSTNPDFLLLGATTPADDDTHYSYELLAPPAGTEFKTNAAGNWYESEAGLPVHRVDIDDAYAAGQKIYDLKSGAELMPEEAFRRAINKDGFRKNYRLQWLLGGTAAIDLMRLKVSMERGLGQCASFIIDSDMDFDLAMSWLAVHLHEKAPVGLSLDVATTTKQKSNPSVMGVVEQHGSGFVVRCFLIWKTRDPDVARERIETVVDLIPACRTGGRARALAIDATNEKYFAEDLRKQFAAKIPTLLVVSSESVERPGLEKPTNWKEYLGDQYVAAIDDNRVTLPPEQYVRIDHRLVKKDRGMFVCEPDAEGRHGDTFDAGKLGLHALTSVSAGVTTLEGIRTGANNRRAPAFRPKRFGGVHA